MVFIQHFCTRCGSDAIRRNGTQAGYAKYQCKVCGYQARFVPAHEPCTAVILLWNTAKSLI